MLEVAVAHPISQTAEMVYNAATEVWQDAHDAMGETVDWFPGLHQIHSGGSGYMAAPAAS